MTNRSFIQMPSFGFKNLAIELFTGEDNFYILDANKVVFLDVDSRVFTILGLLRDQVLSEEELHSQLPQFTKRAIDGALQEIGRLQQKGYLLTMQTSRFSPMERADFEEKLSNKMAGFTVHITSQCNLACSYCIFGGDYERHPELSRTAMTWETARNMVDFLVSHAKEAESLRLDFFGGEPLLEFALIKRTVEYLKTCLSDDKRQITITIASNGTLLSEETLSFLLKHNVYLQFSIDGERSVHDRERRFRNSDHGSFDLILNNLERINDRNPEYFREFVRIKSVITMASLTDAESTFWEHPLIKLIMDCKHESLLIQEHQFNVAQDSAYFDRLHELGKELSLHSGATSLDELTECLNWRQKAFYSQTFADFMEVQAVNKLHLGAKRIGFTKNCLMGYQEGAVQPDGKIAICHKASSFVIGDVMSGKWDFDRIWTLHNRLHNEWTACSSCFAARFCDLCYEKLDGDDDKWAQSRARFCEFTRQKYHIIFGYMLKVLDRNPELWTDMRSLVQANLKEKKEVVRRENGKETETSAPSSNSHLADAAQQM